jgi:hypothetical protein
MSEDNDEVITRRDARNGFMEGWLRAAHDCRRDPEVRRGLKEFKQAWINYTTNTNTTTPSS